MRKSNGIVKTLTIFRQNVVTKFLKRCWIVLAVGIITAAVISSLFRALTPWAKQYKTEVEQHLSVLLGGQVTVSAMETGWYWFEPVIKLNQVSVANGEKEVARLNKLFVGINLLSSILHWQIQPGILFLDDLHLSLHQKNNQWRIDGYDKQKMIFDTTSYQPVLAWVLAQQKIIIKNLSATVYLQDGTLIPLEKLNLTAINRRGHYLIKGKGSLAQAIGTHFQLLADLHLDPDTVQKINGHLFFSVQNLLPAQWQEFATLSRLQLLDGQGNIRLWADLAKGQWKNVQTRLDFHRLALIDKQEKKKHLIQTIKANLAWKQTKEGWLLTGDRLQLEANNIRWPENTLALRYQKNKDTYFLFIKNLLIEPLRSTAYLWPSSIKNVMARKPQGHFHDTQVQFTKHNVDTILTRFSGLGWQAYDNQPGINNLSGVLYWQPNEGRLLFEGKHVKLTSRKQPSLTFARLNAALNWQELSEGRRIHIEQLSLDHPNLLFNARGQIDKISATSPGEMNITAQFSAKEAQYWLPYLPSKHLKPKLEAWFKQNIKRIKNANGMVVINGPLADFPFDKNPGNFTITSHLSGVDLLFTSQWPLTKNIESYLRINKRTLEADIIQANLKKIVVKQGNLRIDDIGLDRETLLIHSRVNTKSDKALAYVFSSPLRKNLSALKRLKMQGLLDLDLQLEIPLYPENDSVLALGTINFQANNLTVHHSMDDVELKDLNGSLQFNQDGVLNSNLKALVFDMPTTLSIQSVHAPKPYTQVKMEGELPIEILAKKFNLPLFAILHGTMELKSKLLLTDNPQEQSHLQIQTSMEGLGVDLPPPLGKPAELSTPLTLNIDFGNKKTTRLRFNYDNRLSSDLWFSSLNDKFELKRGQLFLGQGDALAHNREGLEITGSLVSFDLQQWLATKRKLMQSAGESSLFDVIHRIDIQLKEAIIGKEYYKDLVVKVASLAKEEWSIYLQQPKLVANLHYQKKTNSLTGRFNKLRVEKVALKNNVSNSGLKPADLPNLDLQIDSFQWGELDLGEVSLKAKSLPHSWRLDFCKIKSPSYFLTAKGEWKQHEKINTTTLQGDLHINDLAKSLQRWKISPAALEARQGELRFQGSWPDGLFNFALEKVKGQIAIGLKDGRITHLSPDTEEKLGLGKLLSILSLQTIPRRLKLDFSDLAKDGYSFDQFRGNFSLANGIMRTQNSYIDGPVAYASMKGDLNIAKQLYDVDLKISPHITASLPVVATIAGGPIAGFATWVASRLINQGMQTISGYTYKISGPWQKPIVQQVSIIKKVKTQPS